MILTLVQKVNIEEKLKNATDSGYQIGVVIGSFIPFAVARQSPASFLPTDQRLRQYQSKK